MINRQEQMMQMDMESIPPQMMGGDKSNSYFSTHSEQNLIEWQLEVDSILARVEHMLRGDKITYNEKTKTKEWTTNEDESQRIMNDLGIKQVLNFLDFYLNRNTLLSYYSTDEEIHEKMFNLEWDFADMIYLNYEKFGMTTLEKRKYAPIVCRQVFDMVHSAYKRALQGKERESLREARHIQQNVNGVNPYPQGMGMPVVEEDRFSMNPMRLFKRRR